MTKCTTPFLLSVLVISSFSMHANNAQESVKSREARTAKKSRFIRKRVRPIHDIILYTLGAALVIYEFSGHENKTVKKLLPYYALYAGLYSAHGDISEAYGDLE